MSGWPVHPRKIIQDFVSNVEDLGTWLVVAISLLPGKVCLLEGRKSDRRIGSYLCTAEHKFNATRTNFRKIAQSNPRSEAGPSYMETNVN